MIYPEISQDNWKNKYELEAEVVICPNCKKSFTTIVPILIKGYAGLETPLHECGREFQSAVFKPITQSEIEFWTKSSVS